MQRFITFLDVCIRLGDVILVGILIAIAVEIYKIVGHVSPACP